MKLIYSADDNPQLRVHVAILYPDDPDQKVAIEMAKDMPQCCCMLHDMDVDEKGEFKKSHYHLVFRFDKGYYRKKLVTKDLMLNWESNWHYFKSLEEIEYPRVEDYVVYLTHIDYHEKHHYPASQFQGEDRLWAIDVCNRHGVSDDVNIVDILQTIEDMRFSDHNFKFRPMKEIYMKLYNQYGVIIFKKWNFIKPFITDYKFDCTKDEINS